MTTPRIEEILSNIEDIIQNYHGNWPEEDEMNEILGELRKAHQAGMEEERERILENILKWSKTATVVETTGKEGTKRATNKLRECLAGSYHFLYQAVRITSKDDTIKALQDKE